MSESVVQQDEVSLVPCATCSRTFLPQSLTKHAPICEKTSQKKRKVFNSSKQRVEGTELAQFHQKTYLKRQDSCTKSIKLPNEKSLTSNKPKSLTKLDDVQANLNQINPPKEPNEMPRPTKTPLTTSPNERCPHCGRNFGPKAFDRHVEWCKEHQTRIQKIPTNNPTTLLAKERLEARIKYKVPPLTKTKTILEKYSTTNLHRTASLRQSKNSIVCNTKINKNRDGVKAVKETKRNEESTSNYDPFKSAERQFMELLESDDFKVLTEKTLTRPHTTTSTTIKNDNNNNNGGKKMTRSAEINSIKRKSVIEPPVNFQDTQSTSFVDDINDEDDDDFETLENLLNGGNIDKLFQQLNRKINNNDKNKRKYSDDISSIDSSLINENDNLSIPEQLILNCDHDDDDIYSPTSTECTDITIKNHDEDRDQDQDLYSIQYDKNIETFIENDKKNQTNCKEIKRKTTKKSNNKNNNNKTTKTTNITKTKSPISTKLQDEDTDVFDIDKETYEEFKIYEEMYLRGKDINNSNNNNNNNIKNNSNNNNNTKKHKIANLSYGIPLMSSSTSSSPATSPQSRKTYNDSAYGSLTRKTDSLSQLDLDVSDTGANSPDHLVGNQKMSKFCHECGSKYPLITAKFCVECGVKRLVL